MSIAGSIDSHCMQRLRKKIQVQWRLHGRHRTTKHNDQQHQLLLTPVVLAEIVNDAVKKVKEKIKSSTLTYRTNSSTMSMDSLLKLRNFRRLKYCLTDT